MGKLGHYKLTLYCDDPEHIKDIKWEVNRLNRVYKDYYNETVFIGKDYNWCIAEARKQGWLIAYKSDGKEIRKGNGYCLCPKHSGKGKKKEV